MANPVSRRIFTFRRLYPCDEYLEWYSQTRCILSTNSRILEAGLQNIFFYGRNCPCSFLLLYRACSQANRRTAQVSLDIALTVSKSYLPVPNFSLPIRSRLTYPHLAQFPLSPLHSPHEDHHLPGQENAHGL